MIRPARVLFTWTLASLAACSAPPGAARPLAPRAVSESSGGTRASSSDDGLDYEIELSSDLRKLSVRICPRGRVPRELIAGARSGRAWLRAARIEGLGGNRALSLESDALDLSGMERAECVAYELELPEAGRRVPPELVRFDGAFASNAALWLYRPRDYQRFLPARARFKLPAGMQASLPWPKEGEQYRLDASAFAFHGYAAFGALDVQQLTVGATDVELAVLPGLSQPTREHLEPWARAGVGAASSFVEALRPRLQLVVLPVPGDGGSDPVPFGMMTRGGGASVALLVAADVERDELVRDWVLVHELSHLFLPFVARADAWLSEGIATYYQEVLRARAGLLRERDAWQRLVEGARKAAGLSRSLEEESAHVFRTHAFAPVYWGGASFALALDVELRKRSQGKTSLDTMVAELLRCCSRAVEHFSAERIVELIDEKSGTSAASEALARIARAERFPDLTGLFAQLGVQDGNGTSGADVWIAQAIMRGSDEPASLSAIPPHSKLRAVDGGGTRAP